MCSSEENEPSFGEGIKCMSSPASNQIQVISIGISILGLALSCYVAYRGETKRIIDLRLLENGPLVVERPNLPGGLKLSLDERPIARPWLMSVRLDYSGSTPLLESEFKHLTLRFNSTVLRAETIKSNPKGITKGITFDKGAVTLRSLPLNSGNWVEFNIWFDGKPPTPEVSYDIVGLTRDIEMVSLDKRLSSTFSWTIWWPFPIYVLLNIISMLSAAFGSFVGIRNSLKALKDSFALRSWIKEKWREIIQEISTFPETEQRDEFMFRYESFRLTLTNPEILPVPNIGQTSDFKRALTTWQKEVSQLSLCKIIYQGQFVSEFLLLISCAAVLALVAPNCVALYSALG